MVVNDGDESHPHGIPFSVKVQQKHKSKLLGGGSLSSTKLDSSGIYHVGKYANLTQCLGYDGMKLYMGYNVD